MSNLPCMPCQDTNFPELDEEEKEKFDRSSSSFSFSYKFYIFFMILGRKRMLRNASKPLSMDLVQEKQEQYPTASLCSQVIMPTARDLPM